MKGLNMKVNIKRKELEYNHRTKTVQNWKQNKTYFKTIKAFKT